MNRSRPQLIIGALGVVAFAGAMGWMLTHRKHDDTGPLSVPKLGALKAVHGTEKRSVSPGGRISVLESLDFEIEVGELCFLYVVSARGENTVVQWAPDAAEPWDKGAYAPNWHTDSPEGLRFASPGDATIFLLASPLPIKDIDTWTVAQLAAPTGRCARCTVSVSHFDVTPAPEPAGNAGHQ